MHQNLFSSQIFFPVSAACTTTLSLNWKNNKTMLSVSKIQRMRKFNNQTTASSAVLFLTVFGFNLLEWLHGYNYGCYWCGFHHLLLLVVLHGK